MSEAAEVLLLTFVLVTFMTIGIFTGMQFVNFLLL